MHALLMIVAFLLGATNFLASIIGSVWLAYLGEWKLVGMGIAAMIAGPFLLSPLLMLGLVFGAPAASLVEKGRTMLAFPFAVLSLTFTHIVIAAWCVLVFILVLDGSNSASMWPRLIWAYAVAVGPWAYMASREHQMGSGEGATTTVFFTQIACIAMVVVGLTLRQPGGVPLLAFGGVMALSVLVQSIVVMFATLSTRPT